MLLGVLSDTHDNVATARTGIETLRAAGAEFLIHCGDVGGERIFDLLAGMPSAFVWGNNDYDRASLRRYAIDLGIQCFEEFGELELSKKKIAFTHGDNPTLVRRATTAAKDPYDYLFVGHSHLRTDKHIGKLRMVNPGALHRASIKTVALLDLASDQLRSIAIESE